MRISPCEISTLPENTALPSFWLTDRVSAVTSTGRLLSCCISPKATLKPWATEIVGPNTRTAITRRRKNCTKITSSRVSVCISISHLSWKTNRYHPNHPRGAAPCDRLSARPSACRRQCRRRFRRAPLPARRSWFRSAPWYRLTTSSPPYPPAWLPETPHPLRPDRRARWTPRHQSFRSGPRHSPRLCCPARPGQGARFQRTERSCRRRRFARRNRGPWSVGRAGAFPTRPWQRVWRLPDRSCAAPGTTCWAMPGRPMAAAWRSKLTEAVPLQHRGWWMFVHLWHQKTWPSEAREGPATFQNGRIPEAGMNTTHTWGVIHRFSCFDFERNGLLNLFCQDFGLGYADEILVTRQFLDEKQALKRNITESGWHVSNLHGLPRSQATLLEFERRVEELDSRIAFQLRHRDGLHKEKMAEMQEKYRNLAALLMCFGQAGHSKGTCFCLKMKNEWRINIFKASACEVKRLRRRGGSSRCCAKKKRRWKWKTSLGSQLDPRISSWIISWIITLMSNIDNIGDLNLLTDRRCRVGRVWGRARQESGGKSCTIPARAARVLWPEDDCWGPEMVVTKSSRQLVL